MSDFIKGAESAAHAMLMVAIQQALIIAGERGINVLASAVGSVFAPHVEKLAAADYTNAPPSLIEFVEGVKATAIFTQEAMTAQSRTVILPHEQ